MKIETPKRFAIIGIPGSGKSTFSIKLGKVLGIPVHHLDRHMFEAGGKKKDKQEILAVEQALVNEDAWIVEGCSISTLGTRFAKADIVLCFYLPRLLCIWRICKRLFVYDKALADTGCTRMVDWRLVKYIWKFDQEKRAVIDAVRKAYPQVEYRVFRSSKDADKYLQEIRP